MRPARDSDTCLMREGWAEPRMMNFPLVFLSLSMRDLRALKIWGKDWASSRMRVLLECLVSW